MYPVRQPIVPKINVIMHAPRRKIGAQKQTLPPLNSLVHVTVPKTTRVQKVKPLYPAQIDHKPGEPYFKGPITPQQVVEKYPFLLTDREPLELSNYSEIYYIRNNPPHNKTQPKTIPNFFHFIPNDHIAFRYQQQEVLGKGSFGTVIKCLDHKTGELVAIKLLRDRKKVHEEILFENKIISKLQEGDGTTNWNIIKYIESFQFRGFFCIVMELLWKDTYTVLQNRHYVGYSRPTIQMIAYETARALDFMHKHRIVHCDIKPENIMFITDRKKGIKIIDFGCSCFSGEIMFSYIQSRFYRAPEVVLGIDYDKEIDIWSLGCVLCELVTGKPLFDADSQLELLQMVTETIGEIPRKMLDRAPYAKKFYDIQGSTYNVKRSLKSTRIPGLPNSTSIEREVNVSDTVFIDLIRSCLKWEPSQRITAEGIMAHPWVAEVASQFSSPYH